MVCNSEDHEWVVEGRYTVGACPNSAEITYGIIEYKCKNCSCTKKKKKFKNPSEDDKVFIKRFLKQ